MAVTRFATDDALAAKVGGGGIAAPVAVPDLVQDVVVDNCSSLTGWTASDTGSGGTTVIATGAGPNGENVFEFSIVDGSSSHRLSKTVSFKNAFHSMGFWVQWPDYPGQKPAVTVLITADGFTNYFAFTIQAEENSNKINSSGWEFRSIPYSQFANQGGANASWNNIQTTIRLIVNGDGANARCRIGPIYADMKQPRAKVLLQFDDSNDSDILSSLPVLSNYGLKATSNTILSALGTSQKLTDTNLKTLYNAGWDIACHHETDFRGLNQGVQEGYISGVRDHLLALGLTRAAYHVAYPSGAYDYNTKLAMTAKGMKTGRTIINFAQCPGVNPEYYRLQALGLDTNSGSTGASALAQVDIAITAQATLILYMHGMYGTTIHWNTTDLTTLCLGPADADQQRPTRCRDDQRVVRDTLGLVTTLATGRKNSKAGKATRDAYGYCESRGVVRIGVVLAAPVFDRLKAEAIRQNVSMSALVRSYAEIGQRQER
jgi:peptidoglycan/xylan/chitin deacetylase (PgdA/CDA1 family)